jgi:hypothetical protein
VHAAVRAAGQVPDAPGVDGAEDEVSRLGALARSFDVVEDPLDLRAGKIRVRHQAGDVADMRPQTGRFQLIDDRGSAAALPDDGVENRLTGSLFPHHRSFTLIGDANACQIRQIDAAPGEGFRHHRILRRVDFHGVVFHPPLLGVALCKLPLGDFHDVLLMVKKDRPAAGRTLVER